MARDLEATLFMHSPCGLPVGLCICPKSVIVVDSPPKEPSALETFKKLMEC